LDACAAVGLRASRSARVAGPNKFFERDGRITDITGSDWETLWGRVGGG
jgi:hypothetical protein